jgi:hypothetical protein
MDCELMVASFQKENLTVLVLALCSRSKHRFFPCLFLRSRIWASITQTNGGSDTLWHPSLPLSCCRRERWRLQRSVLEQMLLRRENGFQAVFEWRTLRSRARYDKTKTMLCCWPRRGQGSLTTPLSYRSTNITADLITEIASGTSAWFWSSEASCPFYTSSYRSMMILTAGLANRVYKFSYKICHCSVKIQYHVLFFSPRC